MTAPEKPSTVDEYFAGLPPETREPLEALRRELAGMVPGATEVMSYGMPTLRYRDRVLVHYGAWKHHLALYGLDVAGHAELLAPYDTDKGTIRFSPGAPLPADLLATLIAARTAAIDAAHEARRTAKRRAAG